MKQANKDDRYIFMISKAGSRLGIYMQEQFKKSGLNLTPTQVGILLLVREKAAVSMGEISQVFEVDNSAITRRIEKLEKQGYVRREINPADRRQVTITLTDAGRKASEKALRLSKAANEKIKEGFTEMEMEVFKKVLTAFHTKFK